jgi:endonuclease/exonuclease/phosphatase family metal-dependent hydrolase
LRTIRLLAALVLVVSTASAAFASSCCAGGSSGGATDAKDGTGVTTRVMSFNVRYGTAQDGDNAWERRRDLVVDTVRAFEPDLIGVQESLGFQSEYLHEHLPGFGFVGVGRDDGTDAGEMCAIFYSRSAFDLLDSGHFWLSETPEVPGSVSWDSALTRMASWVRLRGRDVPVDLLFVNTHFDHAGETARMRSAELVLEQARELAGGIPIIVAGDFNAPAAASAEGPYTVLTGSSESALVDTYSAAGGEDRGDDGTFNAFEGRTGGARIDWILVSREVEVLGAGIDRSEREGRYPSDHFPVTAVVRVAAGEASGTR